MITCAHYKKVFNKYKNSVPYANPKYDKSTKSYSYGGWISDFKTYNLKTEKKIYLDLSEEKDLFLLFVLASCWSRTGHYESSAYFVTYLKDQKKDDPDYWKQSTNFVKEKKDCETIKSFIQSNYYQFTTRSISINTNFIDSTFGIAKNWDNIKAKLNEANTAENKKDGWKEFMIYMNSLEGLAGGCGFYNDGTVRKVPSKNNKGESILLNSKMVIKIPLILREMRVAKLYEDIPGEYCCVPDARVCKTVKQAFSDIKLGGHGTINSLIKSSSTIYKEFKDWYDVPLFAYYDIQSKDKTLPRVNLDD